jgi:hypothetical protein
MLLVGVISCNGGGTKSPTAPSFPGGKPTGVDAAPGSKSANVSWNAVPGAAGYYVYISSTGSNFTRVEGGLIHSTAFTIFNLFNGNTYYFGVSAVGVGGWETGISYAGGAPTAMPIVPKPGLVVEPDPEEEVPPLAPANLQGEARDGETALWWDPNTESDFSYYTLYGKRVTDPIFVIIATNIQIAPSPEFPFRNTDLTNGSTYSYYVTATDIEVPPNESDKSNMITLTPMNFPPEAPMNLVLFVAPGRVTLEWDQLAAPDIEFYVIERAEVVDPDTGAQIVLRFEFEKPTTGTQTFLDNNNLISAWLDIDRNKVLLQDGFVESGRQYIYRVSAIDESGQEGSTAEFNMIQQGISVL